jgi:hypothetical protein
LTVQAFVAAVERVTGHRVRRSGRGYMARCPSHPDRTPSLSIAQGNRGILAHDHGGCRLEEILTALNLTPRDLFDDAAPVPRSRGYAPPQPWMRPEIMSLYEMSEAVKVLRRADWGLHADVMERLLDEEILDRASYQPRRPGHPSFAVLLADALGERLTRGAAFWPIETERCSA